MLRFLRREPGFYRHTWMLALPIILQNLITDRKSTRLNSSHAL